jgi:hypothetical protein
MADARRRRAERGQDGTIQARIRARQERARSGTNDSGSIFARRIAGCWLEDPLENTAHREFRALHEASSTEQLVRLYLFGLPEHVSRERLQALAQAGLDHPNLIRVHEVGGFPWAGAEAVFVRRDLVWPQLTVHDRSLLGPYWTWQMALDVVRQTAEAVHGLHVKGWSLERLGARQVFFDQAGRVRIDVLDIARPLEEDDRRQAATRLGELLGLNRLVPRSDLTETTRRAIDRLAAGCRDSDSLTPLSVAEGCRRILSRAEEEG